MIRAFDAFSGIGGFRSALERIRGLEILAQCEIDKFAQKAYRALYDTGGEQFYENIRNIGAGELADFDLLTEGFPVSRSRFAKQEKASQTSEAIFSLNFPEFLKIKDHAIFCLRAYPNSWRLIQGANF